MISLKEEPVEPIPTGDRFLPSAMLWRRWRKHVDPETSISGGAMPKILIIDDDVQLCTALQVHLEKENHSVLCVGSGVDALETVEQETPNLILLDLAMPDLDGIRILDQLKHSVIAWDIPVVVFTAKGDLDDRERTLRMGATRYLQKPLSPKELAIAIAAVLRGSATAPQER